MVLTSAAHAGVARAAEITVANAMTARTPRSSVRQGLDAAWLPGHARPSWMDSNDRVRMRQLVMGPPRR
jgi:hypothetical protein